MFSVLALAGTAAAYANTTTVDTTKWVTIPCSTPTTVTYGKSTYTVTEATTLTVEDCGCTDVPHQPSVKPSAAPTNTAPIIANAAPQVAMGGAAAAAAAVAFLI